MSPMLRERSRSTYRQTESIGCLKMLNVKLPGSDALRKRGYRVCRDREECNKIDKLVFVFGPGINPGHVILPRP